MGVNPSGKARPEIFSGPAASCLSLLGDKRPNTRNMIDACDPVSGAYVQ